MIDDRTVLQGMMAQPLRDQTQIIIASLRARIAELERERDTPETANFLRGVPLEAAHQRSRWGSEHDGGKTTFDWFWLIGYLAQKSATAAVAGDTAKAMHHTISTAAALCNWHAALAGEDTSMRPGIKPPSEYWPMTMQEFRDALACLLIIDESHGQHWADERAEYFLNDADDEERAAIWREVERRMGNAQ